MPAANEAQLASVRAAFEKQEKKKHDVAISRSAAGKKWCGIVD